MGDFEQSLRDQFGSERNQRIAILKTTANLLRARLEAAEQRLSQEQEAMHADLRTLLKVLGLPSGAQPKSPHEVMLGAVEEVRKRTAELAAERTARQEAEKLLHDLTPMGSEFYERPEKCAKWIAETISSHTQQAVEQTAKRREAEEGWAETRKEAESLYDTADRYRIKAEAAEAQVVALRSELTNARELLEYSLGEGQRLREALEKLTDWGLSPDDVVEIARAALSQPSPAAERVRALEEIAQIARALYAAKDRRANYDWVDERASMEEYEQVLAAELDADTQLRAAIRADDLGDLDGDRGHAPDCTAGEE